MDMLYLNYRAIYLKRECYKAFNCHSCKAQKLCAKYLDYFEKAPSGYTREDLIKIFRRYELSHKN